jgi:predicted nucleic-acid-binding Zn-ribbon protein
VIEGLVLKRCPRCQSDERFWHEAGIFLVTSNSSEHGHGGYAQAAAVVCPNCGLIEFYGAHSPLLKELPQMQVPTESESA